MLRATDLDAGYGELTVLHRVSLEVQEGEILSVIGPNGAGKTTLLRTLAGLTAATAGTVAYRDEDITAMSVPDRVRRGISLVPEERHLFRDMTVRENLTLGSFTARDRKEDIIQRVFDLFPRLSERSDQHAGTLSGGEAQMLTIGRGLMTDPEVLLMDEPSLGLAPKLVPELFEKVRQINDEGISIVIVEQQIDRALELADTGCLLENGEITMRGRATELMNDPEVVEKYLGGE